MADNEFFEFNYLPPDLFGPAAEAGAWGPRARFDPNKPAHPYATGWSDWVRKNAAQEVQEKGLADIIGARQAFTDYEPIWESGSALMRRSLQGTMVGADDWIRKATKSTPVSEATKKAAEEANRRELFDLFELGSPEQTFNRAELTPKPTRTAQKKTPEEAHGQPYDFGTLEIYMHPDESGTYSPHWLLPEGVDVLTGTKDEPIGLYNTKTGGTWGIPTKGPKYPFIKVNP